MTEKKEPRIALLTNCTQSANYDPIIDVEDAPRGETMKDLLDWWEEQINEARSNEENLKTPGEIYAGISFDAVAEIAHLIGRDNVYVVNRGAGLVKLTDKMIPYNFVYERRDENGARSKISAEKFVPQMWWLQVNDRLHGTPTPIADLAHDYDHIVVALPKNFIKLISKDLATVPDAASKVIIPIPVSTSSGIARALRPSCVPYTKQYTYDLDYSRYNKTQKVAQKFLIEGLQHGSLESHANAVRDAQNALDANRVSQTVEYERMFEDNPQLLKCSTAQAAMEQAKMKGLRIGSRQKFTGAWLGAQGVIKIEEPDEQHAEEAADALSAVMQKMGSKRQGTDDELLRQIRLFVTLVEREEPELIFTSREVAEWGKLMYGKNTMIASTNKVAGILKAYTAHLGIEQVPIGKKTAYRVAK